MYHFKRHAIVFWGLVALLLAFMVAGCGGGGGGGGAGSPLIQASNSAPGAAGTVLPGAAPAVPSSPSVITANPSNAAVNVAVLTVEPDNSLAPRAISATFSEPMNPATLVSPSTTFTVKETVSDIPVAGSVSLDSSNTVATFTPAAPLAPNTQFTAIITTAATSAAGTALSSGVGWSFTTGSQVGQTPINLKTAASFLVLGGTSIDNVSSAPNPTRVNGQLGIDPGSTTNVTGFTQSTPAGTGIILTGGIQFGALVTQAKTDLLAALTEANARTSHQVIVGAGDLSLFTGNGAGAGVYPPGLYSSATTLNLNSGNMTLDARGDPDAVWVFKAASQLIVGDTRQMVLLNGARARNVFWTLGSDALIGDGVSFKGNVLAGTSNSIGTASAVGTTVEGRVLSVSGLHLNYTTINTPAL